MLCSVTQLCLFATLWSLPGSSVLGVLQARILGCVAFPITGDLPDSGIEARSLASPAVDFFFYCCATLFDYICAYTYGLMYNLPELCILSITQGMYRKYHLKNLGRVKAYMEMR